MIIRSLFFLLCAVAFAAAPDVRAQQAAATPDQVAQGMLDELDRVMKTRKAELEKNREALLKVVDDIVLPHFDLDYAAILMLGYNARSATPEQRIRFAKAMYNSISRRYADGVLQYTEKRVRLLPSQGELNDRRTLVRTEITGDDGKAVSVNYAFRKTAAGDWRFYDVIVEGISYITNYRNQVTAEIQKSGLDGLISRLESQGAAALEPADKGAGSDGQK